MEVEDRIVIATISLVEVEVPLLTTISGNLRVVN